MEGRRRCYLAASRIKQSLRIVLIEIGVWRKGRSSERGALRRRMPDMVCEYGRVDLKWLLSVKREFVDGMEEWSGVQGR